jgi:hypothetical protein
MTNSNVLESSENFSRKRRRPNEIIDTSSKTKETDSLNSVETKKVPLKSILKKPKDSIENQSSIEQSANESHAAVNKSDKHDETIIESDEQILKLIKNRLTALTLLERNITQMNQLSQEYQLRKETLMNDYFGFCDKSETNDKTDESDFDDVSKKEELFNNLEKIKNEREKSMEMLARNTLNSKENASTSFVPKFDANIIATVPKALIALKYKIPMLFINKLFYYLSGEMLTSNKNILTDKENNLDFKNRNENQEKESSNFSITFQSDNEFYSYLFELQKKLYANRNDLNRMVEILNENKCKMVRKF